MVQSENITRESLLLMVEERGRRVLPRFRQETVSGVTDPKLLEVLRFVCDYWKDNFRPAFAGLCCEAVGGQSEKADDVSLMVTLTAAGGGIHDDILDKSLNKHFRMTVLGKYGLETALLVGDLLIQKGWALARNIVEKTVPKKLAEILQVFGNWTLDLCEAEFMEIQCRKNLDTEVDFYERLLCKSMADTRACARFGAIMGGGSNYEIQALTEFGGRLGFMYRLADDLKDTLNVEYNLLDRLQNESVPLPILYAAKTSEKTTDAIRNITECSSVETMDVEGVLNVCIQSGAIGYMQRRAKETVRAALEELRCLGDTMAKKALSYMVNDSLMEISELSTRVASIYQHGLTS